MKRKTSLAKMPSTSISHFLKNIKPIPCPCAVLGHVSNLEISGLIVSRMQKRKKSNFIENMNESTFMVSNEDITSLSFVFVPPCIEVLGSILVQQLPPAPHDRLAGRLLHLRGHLLQGVSPRGPHRHQLGHAGPLKVVEVVEGYVDVLRHYQGAMVAHEQHILVSHHLDLKDTKVGRK